MRENKNYDIIKEPIDLLILLIESILYYNLFAGILFIIIIISSLVKDNSSFFNTLLEFGKYYFILMIPSCVFLMINLYVHYNLTRKKYYYLENGAIHIVFGSKFHFRKTIFLDDVIDIQYVERLPYYIFLYKKYRKYYTRFYFPHLIYQFYFIELIDNHKFIYENKICRINQISNDKRYNNKYSIIPKKVLDEYIKKGYFIPDHITVRYY